MWLPHLHTSMGGDGCTDASCHVQVYLTWNCVGGYGIVRDCLSVVQKNDGVMQLNQNSLWTEIGYQN